jgi:hypothetical protein
MKKTKAIVSMSPSKSKLYSKSAYKKDYKDFQMRNPELDKFSPHKTLKQKNCEVKIKKPKQKPESGRRERKFERAVPILPKPSFKPPRGEFEGHTTYNKSFHSWTVNSWTLNTLY